MIGETIGNYRIESELGSGGMGTVWLATDDDGHRFAVKVIHPHLLESPGFFKRFLREAEIGKAVRHPNVVRCHDADAIIRDGKQQNFLVMEYVEGQTLRDLLAELGRVPEELCRHIGCEVAKGLSAIHEAGVIHRDLKPENVLITPDHVVKVMDLGVARAADEVIRLSQTGAFVGSIHYAAPEQFRMGGKDLDGRADLHALGVILYELASGTHPYLADDVSQVLNRVLNHQARRLGEINPQISAFLEEAAHNLMAKDRDDRFPSAKDLLAALDRGEESTWWRGRARSLRAETKRPLRRIRIPRETAVYGREAELDSLRSFYEKASGGEGQVVLIEGEAGIGKTRLVDELIAQLRQDGEDLNFLFGSYPPGGAATAAGAWSTAYREQFGVEGLEETLAEYLGVTPVLIPAFAALLRGEPPPEEKEPLTKDSIQTVFVHATQALAAERTTVVLIEDLHFAPEDGRAMFASLALAVPGHRILLLGTARPGIPETWRANLERQEPASRIELPRLGPKDLVTLLVDAFRSERLAEELGIRIAAKSDGNPFFVFEIIRGLREGRFITKQPDGTWVSTNVIRDIEIPSSVQDLIEARISDLDEEEQELLDVAACCGFEFDPGLVADAVGYARIPSLRKLGHLEKAHRLIRSAGRNFVFDHHQAQEAIYAGVSVQLREEYHIAIGTALAARHPEPEGPTAVDLCEHFLKARHGWAALPFIDAALDHLEENFSNDRTVELADAALGVPGLLEGRERMEVLFRKAARLALLGRRADRRVALDEALVLADGVGEALHRARAYRRLGGHLVSVADHDEALAAVHRAIEFAKEVGDEGEEARCLITLGNVSLSQSRFAEAGEILERSLALFRRVDDRKGEVRASGNLGVVSLRLARFEEAEQHFERTLAISREIGDHQAEAVSMANLSILWGNRGENEAALDLLDRSLALSRAIGDRGGEARTRGTLGNALLKSGNFENAAKEYERRLALSREIGDRHGEGHARGGLGNAFYNLGRIHEAVKSYEKSGAILRELGDLQGEAGAMANLGSALSCLGFHEQAGEGHARALAILRDMGDRKNEAVAIGNLGLVAMMLGRLAEARERFEEYLRLAREISFRYGEENARVGLGDLHAILGDGEAAREHLEACRALSREGEEPTTEGYAVHGLAKAAEMQGDADAAIRLAQEAVEIRREISYSKGLAETLAVLGGLLLDSGRIEEARAPLEEALAIGLGMEMPGPVVLSRCHLARLPGGDADAARATLEEFESRLSRHGSMTGRYLLYRITGDAAHLEAARGLLRQLVEHAPREYRETMISHVLVHREIIDAVEDPGSGSDEPA